MKLMTAEIRKALKERPLYSTDGDKEATSICKFFTPDSSWTWHVFEFDGDNTFFGLVEGIEREWGYFRLSELESVRGPLGLPVERDLYYTPRAKKWFESA